MNRLCLLVLLLLGWSQSALAMPTAKVSILEIDINGYRPCKRYALGEDFSGSSKSGETIAFKLRRQKTVFDANIRIGKRPTLRRER